VLGDEFKKLKSEGAFPFGSLPVLEDGDFKLAQGPACVIYAAKLLNQWPTNIRDDAYATSLLLASEDVRLKTIPIWFMKDGEEKTKKLQETVAWDEAWLHHVGKLLGDKHHFVGDKVTGADLVVFDAIHSFIMPFGVKIPQNLQAFHDSIAKHERIAKWLETHDKK